MNSMSASQNVYNRTGLTSGSWFGLALVILFFLASGFTAYRNIGILRADTQKVQHTHDVITNLGKLLSSTQDAETGQRGFLLTGDEQYLAPYNQAVSRAGTQLDQIAQLTRDNEAQQDRLITLRGHVDAKLVELNQTIELRRRSESEALAIVNSGRGKAEMDAVRTQLDLMQQEETRLREVRIEEMEGAYQTAWATGIASAVLGIVLTLLVGFLVQRASSLRARQQWLQAGQADLASAMLGDPGNAELGENILAFLTRFLGAQGGAIFAGNGATFNRLAMQGVPGDARIVEHFALREGLLGQAAAEQKAIVLQDIPDGYLTLGSALGQDKPRHLVIAPVTADDVVQGVIELGFLQPVPEDVATFLEEAQIAIGTALRSARFRAELQHLLEETQRQSEELQVQSEELRVSNEELEEQGRALKESQARLEQQQVELEQINAQLEEQAQQLETQRDDLVRTGAAVELKARELEQACQY